MAWEAVTKEEIAKLAGGKSSALQDEWYEYAVSFIAKKTGITNIGLTASVTEVHNGDGTNILQVNSPPITSIASVTIDGSLVDSDSYSHTDYSIYFKDVWNRNPYIGSYFPEGSGNVEVVYTSGQAPGSVDKNISLCIALIVREFAKLNSQEGAEAYLQFYRPGRSTATELPLIEWGLHGKLNGIVNSILGLRLRAK